MGLIQFITLLNTAVDTIPVPPDVDTDDGLWHDTIYFTSDDGFWHDTAYFTEDDGFWHDNIYF